MSSPDPNEQPTPKVQNEMVCMMAATLMQRLIPPYETPLPEIEKIVYYCVSIAQMIYAEVEKR